VLCRCCCSFAELERARPVPFAGVAVKHIPRAGEQVFVNEYEAIFTVAHTYHETQTADLLPVGSGPSKEDVPWRKLFRCWPLTRRTNQRNSQFGLSTVIKSF